MTIPSAAPHPLDHVIWSALTTRHAPLAQGSPLAWCYPPEVAPFAALANRSEAAFESLHALMQPGERAVLFTVDALSLIHI